MSLALNIIKKSKGGTQKKKRVGRGNASGHGTYSTRGMKGQRARSGVSGLKRMGMKKQLLQIPKNRGFKSLQPKNQVISIKTINERYKDNEIVSPETLKEKDLIKSIDLPVKILGKESLTVKGLKFEKVKMSASVKGTIK
ncbi:MAG: 50S ribosomal protein L15 [Patescibacteria group bacterium]